MNEGCCIHPHLIQENPPQFCSQAPLNANYNTKTIYNERFGYLLSKFENLLKTIKRYYKVFKIEVMYDCEWQAMLHDSSSPVFQYFKSQPITDSYKYYVSPRQALKVSKGVKSEIRFCQKVTIFSFHLN